jgi:hypothetical protein
MPKGAFDRRHMEPGLRAAIGPQLAPYLEAVARERQREAGGDQKSPSAKSKASEGKSLEPISAQAIDTGRIAVQIAALVDVAPSTVRQAKAVAAASPRLAESNSQNRLDMPPRHI